MLVGNPPPPSKTRMSMCPPWAWVRVWVCARGKNLAGIKNVHMPANPQTRNIVPDMWTHVLYKEVIRDSRFPSSPHPFERQLPAHPSPPRAPHRLYITPTKRSPAATTPIPPVPPSTEPPHLSLAISPRSSPVVAQRPQRCCPGDSIPIHSSRGAVQWLWVALGRPHPSAWTSDSDWASYSLDLTMATPTASIRRRLGCGIPRPSPESPMPVRLPRPSSRRCSCCVGRS
jgi:hypothetical protein